MQLSQFKVLSFDCYGTLIDWEAGIAEALAPLTRKGGVGAEELLEAYGPIEPALEEEHPDVAYSQRLEEVHARLSQHFVVEQNREEAAEFGAPVGDCPAFPVSTEALRY